MHATSAGPVRSERLLEVQGLVTGVAGKSGTARILRGVSLSLARGEVLGIVGESGAGKSMLGNSVMQLLDPPVRILAGKVLFGGIDLVGLPDAQMQRLRGRRLSMVFQDPMTTLSPTHRVGTLLADVIGAHRRLSASQVRERCLQALVKVGIPSPGERLAAYPHELSGGMRQRVCIAAAMINDPELVIADEPTTALDVTTQAQILAQVRRLRDSTGAGFLWITHDLGVVAQIADRIAVMYAGQVVEQGPARELLTRPRHPYTAGLLDSIPVRNRGRRRLPLITGMAPRPDQLDGGCAFRARCGRASNRCSDEPPVETAAGSFVRCFHPLGAGA